ncbi:unnamed protein product [Amoebophrya sp. A120]|nr:unnamed protein product [Amoebophrya sp. A120]|eukprot:GSA120T00020563001.1
MHVEVIKPIQGDRKNKLQSRIRTSEVGRADEKNELSTVCSSAVISILNTLYVANSESTKLKKALAEKLTEQPENAAGTRTDTEESATQGLHTIVDTVASATPHST